MNTFKMQVPNGFMLAAGFGIEKPMNNKPKVKLKIKADKSDKTTQNRIKITNNINRQKKMIKGVIDGINTTDKAKEVSGMTSLPLLRMYFKRLADDGYLSKVKAYKCREFIYSVTDKGLEFIGVKNA